RDEPPRSSPWQNPIAGRGGASSSEMSPERSWLLLDDEFDAAIARLPVVGVVGRHRLGAAVTDRGKPARRQAVLHQIISHRLGALFRQSLVCGAIAIGVGMSGDLDIGGRTTQR